MTVTRLTEYHYVASRADAKPDAINGARLYEFDTGQWYQRGGSTWHAVVTAGIDWSHARVHAGKMWIISHAWESVANDGTADIVVSVGSDPLHAVLRASAEGSFLESVRESPSHSGGSPAAIKNANRIVGDSGAPVAVHSPTVSDPGSPLVESFLAGGIGGISAGAIDEGSGEIVLAENTDYLFRLTNKRGQAADMSLVIRAYDPT